MKIKNVRFRGLGIDYSYIDVHSPLTFFSLICDNCIPIDRNWLLNSYSQLDYGTNEISFFSIYEHDQVSSNIEDIIFEVAKDVTDKYKDRDICLMWSGGIDSTTILTAMQQLDIEFHIACTSAIYNEYQRKYNEIVADKYNIYMIDSHKFAEGIAELQKQLNNPVFITGCCGNIIFHRELDIIGEIWNCSEELNNAHWKQAIKYLCTECVDISNNVEFIRYANLNWKSIIEVIEYYFKRLNIDIEHFTFYSLRALLLLVFYWNRETSDFYIVSRHHYDVFRFFSDIRFQKWCLDNKFSANIKYNSNNIVKKELKEFIYKYDRDLDYYTNKKVIHSLSRNLTEDTKHIVIDTPNKVNIMKLIDGIDVSYYFTPYAKHK